jgi:hypothetical protein
MLNLAMLRRYLFDRHPTRVVREFGMIGDAKTVADAAGL